MYNQWIWQLSTKAIAQCFLVYILSQIMWVSCTIPLEAELQITCSKILLSILNAAATTRNMLVLKGENRINNKEFFSLSSQSYTYIGGKINHTTLIITNFIDFKTATISTFDCAYIWSLIAVFLYIFFIIFLIKLVGS